MKATFWRAKAAVLALLALIGIGCAAAPEKVSVEWLMLDYQFDLDWFAKTPPAPSNGEPGLRVPKGSTKVKGSE